MLTQPGQGSPSCDPAVDALLLRLARCDEGDAGSLLAAAAAALNLDAVRCWAVSARGLDFVAMAPPGDAPPAAPVECLPVLEQRRTVVRTAADGTSLVAAGIWRGGRLAGVLECSRRAGEPWSEFQCTVAAGVADRLGSMQAFTEQQQLMLDRLRERELELDAAGRAMRSAESRFRAVFEQFPHSIQTFAPDGTPTSVNPAYRRLWGCGVEDLAGFNLRTDPQLEPIRHLVERAFAGETVFLPPLLYDIREVAPRHTSTLEWPRWIQATHFPIVDGAGRVTELMVVHEDVTDRVQSEEALRASEEAYRTIFDSSNDAVFLHDIETGAVLDANRIACELNGATLEELRTRGLELIGAGPEPYTRERAVAHLAAAAAGEPQRFEWCTVHRESGAEMWVEVGLQRVTIRGQHRLLALVRDIRERKRAERALIESEQAYRTIFQHSAEAIWVHDAQTGEMLDVNDAGCAMYGYTREEMLALGHDALLYPGSEYTAERVAGVMALALAGESPRFEWMGLHRDGSATWGEVTLRRVTVSGRDLVLATVRDIRARKSAEQDRQRAEEALRRANDELEQRVAERTAELAAANVALEEEVAEHEAARELLLDRTSELEGVFRALPDLYFRTGADGTVLDFRAGDASKLALPPEQFLDRRLQEVLPPAVATAVDDALQLVAARRELVHFEYALDMPEATRDFEARFVPLGAEQVIIVVRDITERKQAERALRRSEEHFRALIENAHDITSIIDASGRLLYTTPAFSRILGWSTEELIGQDVFDYFHPEDAERDRPVLQAILENPGSTGRSSHRFRHRDGSYRYLEAFGRTLAPDCPDEGVVVNIRDVTERRMAEEALRQSEEHFRRMIENSSDQLMIVDATGAITYVGPSVQRLLGYSPAEMLGHRPADLVHPDDVAHVMEVLEDIVRHPGEMRWVQYRIRHRDGSWRVFENAGKTLSPTSAAEGVVANGRDVTERVRAEEALREATAAAEQANRAKSEFLSRMSHELRTPMNSILGFAQVLEGDALPARQDRCVQHILRAGRHLLKLINEVLEISRIEAGGQNLSLEPVRIGAVIQEAVALARPMAEQRNVDVRYGTVHEAEYVHADRQRLSQVLLNLLSNAIKYNRTGGRVRVACEIAGSEESQLLRLRVVDTGYGIAADRQADLFTPFARLGAENSEIEGTGLGLALSQRLAEAMGGRLALERTSSDGTAFALELRLAQSPLQRVEESGAAARRRSAVAHEPATLLYIEDNLANLSLVETILWERPKWRVIPALQGQIGVELAREHVPDLVLLDLHLPDMRGEDVLRRLREEPRTAGIPVVVISADATRAAADRLHAAGAAAFLTKPIDVAEFLATMERMLPTSA